MSGAQTWTVVSGYTDRDGRHWVHVRGLAHKLSAETAYPEGTAVRVEGGKAVKS